MDITFRQNEGTFNYRVGAVLMNEDKILVAFNSGGWHYLPGGRVRLMEGSVDALAREFREELYVDIHINRMLWVHENFFELGNAKTKFHEIGLYFLVETNEIDDIPKESEFEIRDIDGNLNKYFWVQISELSNINLQPEFLQMSLTKLPDKTIHIL